MRLHALFGPNLPNRKQRYCGPEGPEIDGQTKMAKNSLYSTGVFTVTFNRCCPSVFGLLITFVIEMGMALEHVSWPLLFYFFWLNYIIYCLRLLTTKR